MLFLLLLMFFCNTKDMGEILLILFGVSVSFCFIIGFNILARDFRAKLNKASFFLITSAMLWSVTTNLIDGRIGETPTIFLSKLSFFFFILVAVSILNLANVVLPEDTKRTQLINLVSTLSLTTTFVVLVFSSVLQFFRLEDVWWAFTYSWVHYFIAILFSVLTFSGIYLIYANRKRSIDYVAKQLEWLDIGLFLGAIGALLTYSVLPSLTRDLEAVRFCWIALPIWVATLYRTVFYFDYEDFKAILYKSFNYFLSICCLIALYILVIYVGFLRSDLTKPEDFNFILNSLIIALAMAISVNPLNKIIKKLTNKIFYSSAYNMRRTYDHIMASLVSEKGIKRLLNKTSEILADTFKAEQIFFIIEDKGSEKKCECISGGTKGHETLHSDEYEEIKRYIESRPVHKVKLLLKDTPTRSAIWKLLVSHDIKVVVPIYQENKIIGMLFLGRLCNDHSYSERDMHLVNIILNELSLAIQNVLALQQIKNINGTLEQRINNATRELRRTNEQLHDLDRAKDEFISMASHQLRTPLTSMKGLVSMVLEGDVGKINKQQRELLQDAYISSDRMVHIINDFLNVSRLQTGKFVIDVSPVNLAKLVKEEIDSLQVQVKAHDMKLEVNLPDIKTFPVYMLDDTKIRQVVINFIDNAIYYSKPDSKIKVFLELDKITGDILFYVKDNGIGIPKEAKEHLFEKFYRADNARKQRPDGTGVGIFLAKKVIDSSNGEIMFTSEEGKGSTFGFKFKKQNLIPFEPNQK